MKNVILIAPPAAGKGTVSSILKEIYGYSHLAAGDILRDEIKSGSELGNNIKDIVENGRLVDDAMLKELMFKKIKTLPKDKAFVLDGYPRKINQAEDYRNIAESLNLELGKAIFLDVDEETAIKRTLSRLTCQHCKLSYNTLSLKHKPIKEGICDKCGEKLEVRKDDNEITFKNRFETYLKETEPLIEYYKSKNNLLILDAKKDSNILVKEIINSFEDFNDKN